MRVSLIAVIAASMLTLTVHSHAETNPPYFKVDPPQLTSDTRKLEVVEIFSYGCIHCAQFQGLVDAWRSQLDAKKVEFVYLPSPYNASDTLLARGYFAANTLGVVEKTHHGLFQAIHERGARVQSQNDLIALYTQLGVPAEQFSKAVKDFFVESQVRRALDLMLKYKIDATPTLIVAGKYRITTESAGSQEAMIKVANQLIAKELAQTRGTSRQTAKSGK